MLPDVNGHDEKRYVVFKPLANTSWCTFGAQIVHHRSVFHASAQAGPPDVVPCRARVFTMVLGGCYYRDAGKPVRRKSVKALEETQQVAAQVNAQSVLRGANAVGVHAD